MTPPAGHSRFAHVGQLTGKDRISGSELSLTRSAHLPVQVTVLGLLRTHWSARTRRIRQDWRTAPALLQLQVRVQVTSVSAPRGSAERADTCSWTAHTHALVFLSPASTTFQTSKKFGNARASVRVSVLHLLAHPSPSSMNAQQ